MAKPPAARTARRILWILLLAIVLPTATVLALAINAVESEFAAQLDRERSYLHSLAVLRARELDTLPGAVDEALARAQPIRNLSERPRAARSIIRRFFALNPQRHVILPRPPFEPPVFVEPYVVIRSDPDAFLTGDDSGLRLGTNEEREEWLDRFETAEGQLENKDRSGAAATFQRLADETAACYFGYYTLFLWAELAETETAAAREAVRLAYQRIADSSFRELVPERPLRLESALRATRLAWSQNGEPEIVFALLTRLYGPGGRDATRSAFRRIEQESRRLLPRSTALPPSLERLRRDREEQISLATVILPTLSPAKRGITFVRRRLDQGAPLVLAYRHGSENPDYVEGGIVDLEASVVDFSRAGGTSDRVAFSVTDAQGRVLCGPETIAKHPLLAQVSGGPADLFRVRAFHADPTAFVGPLERRRRLLIGLLTLLAIVALIGTAFAFRGLRRELELASLKTEFISGVSHELRTPLTTIQMCGETLALGRVRDDAHRATYYDAINKEGARLHKLIDDLLDFGRMEAGRTVVTLDWTDAARVAEDARADFERSPEGQSRRLTFEAEDAGSARLDGPAIGRAILNLLVNAAKYSPASSPIELRCGGDEDSVSFSVRDHGAGVPRRYRRRIFDEFFRVPDVQINEVKGTGLGLALVRQIAEAHGGRVDLETEVGHGSCFTIVLPRNGPPVDNID